MLDDAERKSLISRLNRIEGQVRAIRRMVEDETYCVDVLHLIAAVQAALGKVGSIVLENHMQGCVTEAFSSGNTRKRQKMVRELTEIFHRYGRVGSR